MPGGAVSARGAHGVRILGLLCGCVCVVVVSVCHPGRGACTPPLVFFCSRPVIAKMVRGVSRSFCLCFGVVVWLVFAGFVVAWGGFVAVVLILRGSSQFVAALLVGVWRSAGGLLAPPLGGECRGAAVCLPVFQHAGGFEGAGCGVSCYCPWVWRGGRLWGGSIKSGHSCPRARREDVSPLGLPKGLR